MVMQNINNIPDAPGLQARDPGGFDEVRAAQGGSGSGTRTNVIIQGNPNGAPTVTGTISGNPNNVTLNVNGTELNPGEVLTDVSTSGGEEGGPVTTTETTTTLSADGKVVTTKTVTTTEDGGSTRRSTRISTRSTSSLAPAPSAPAAPAAPTTAPATPAAPAETSGGQTGTQSGDTGTTEAPRNTGTSRAGEDFQGTNRTSVRAVVSSDEDGTTVTGAGEGNPDNVSIDVGNGSEDPTEVLVFNDTTVDDNPGDGPANSEGVVEDRINGVTGTDGDDTLVRSDQTVGITLDGGAGNDTLIGTEGASFENFVGGDGVDSFVINGGGGTNRIQDFDASNETITLNVEGINSFEDLQDASPFGNLANFRFDDGTSLNVVGFTQDQLSAENFNFNG